MTIDPSIIEKAAKALHDLACVDTLTGHTCGHSSHEGDANHLEAAVVLHEAADDLRAEGAARALREAAADMRCAWEGTWNLRDPLDPETAYSPDRWLEVRADRLEVARLPEGES